MKRVLEAFVNVELRLPVKILLIPVMLPIMFVNAERVVHALEEKFALLEHALDAIMTTIAP